MEGKPKFKPDSGLRLMDQVRQVLRHRHYSYRTEQTYCDWIVRYVKFHGARVHPKNMGKKEVESFLSHLAIQGNVSAATQRQALNAIIFLYRHVLDMPIEGQIEPVRARRQPRYPVVMTQSEVQRVLAEMKGVHLLMAKLLYGSGLRLMECVRLRVQDLDFEKSMIYVRAAKGGKDRLTVFPRVLQSEMKNQIEKVRRLHDEDLAENCGEVYLPEGL